LAFRRNIDKAGEGQIRRKAIVLTGAIVAIFVLTKLLLDAWSEPSIYTIKVEMLSQDVFIVQQDTTNYDRFASILKKEVVEAKKKYTTSQIQLHLPDVDQSKEITNVIMVVTAMNIDWSIHTKK
jgi:hypothetical protein